MIIALITAPYDRDRYRTGESLGIKYLASALEAVGHEVDVFEMALEHMGEVELLEHLTAREYGIIGFGALFTVGIQNTLSLIRSIKRALPTAHFTMGGQGTSFIWQDLLSAEKSLDSCVAFEGEETIVALAEAIETRSALDKIPGLFARNGSIVSPGNFRDPVSQVDELPFPRRVTHSRIEGQAHFMMMTSRGCSAHCTFCASGSFGNKYHDLARWRPRTAKNVLEEIDDLVTTHGATALSFIDDDFLGACASGPIRAREIVAMLESRPYRIRWSMECRVDEVDFELFKAMKNVGLAHVLIGIDAGNEADLKLYAKGTDSGAASRALDILRTLDISRNVGFIMFHPGSQLEAIHDNLLFMSENKFGNYDTITNKLELYRGSPLIKYFSRMELLELSGFGYKYRYLDPRIGMARKALRIALKPFKSIEQKLARLRFGQQVAPNLNSQLVSESAERVSKLIRLEDDLSGAEVALALQVVNEISTWDKLGTNLQPQLDRLIGEVREQSIGRVSEIERIVGSSDTNSTTTTSGDGVPITF